MAVGAAVVVAELTDSRTMSEAFDLARKHKVAGPVIILCYTYLTAHLFRLMPLKYDILHQLAVHTFAKGRYEC
jgi:hypothetical protein